MLVDLGFVTTGSVGTSVPAQDGAPAQGEEFGEASPIALVVIIVLAVATAFLIRNMTKRIRRLPESFDEPEQRAPDEHVTAEQASEQDEQPHHGGSADNSRS